MTSYLYQPIADSSLISYHMYYTVMILEFSINMYKQYILDTYYIRWVLQPISLHISLSLYPVLSYHLVHT